MSIYKQDNRLYAFGNYLLNGSEFLLLRDGKPIPLQPKVFATLLILVERHGHVIGKEELMRLIWPDTFVEEINLAKNISILRKTLTSDETGREFIETLPKRGYRFVCPVQEIPETNTNSLQSELAPNNSSAFISNSEQTEADAQTAQTEIKKEGFFKHSFLVPATLSILLLLIFAAYWLYAQNKSDILPISSRQPQISRVTTSSNASETAISPDGKLIAYVLGEFGKQSLSVK